MKLNVKINEHVFNENNAKIPQGSSFADEYNETLDSGTIIVTHVPCMNELKPYDDVYIWDAEHTFQGYNKELIYFDNMPYIIENYKLENGGLPELQRNGEPRSYTQADLDNWKFTEDTWSEIANISSLKVGRLYYIKCNNTTAGKIQYFVVKYLGPHSQSGVVRTENYEYYNTIPTQNNIFYKHLLVNNFSEKLLNLKDLSYTQGEKGVGGQTPLYEYTIQLFSETKGLEMTQMPNKSITEPLKISKKKSAYYFMKKIVELYSPLYKVANTTNFSWKYEKKYSVSTLLISDFNNVYSPDFSLNNSSLREFLAKLMVTKDMIPYVKNDVIYALDITKRNGTFNVDIDSVNNISGSMTSADYCDNLRKNYSEGLSEKNSARTIEYLGFRNSDSALMTLENMRLETKFPIYKINKIHMCYYKKIALLDENGKEFQKMFLCKQDITPLIKLNTERNALSQDWSSFPESSPNIEEMSKYKLCTLGYDIGSNYIAGWGEKYTYPKGFWDITKSYIENIFNSVDKANPTGIYGNAYFLNQEYKKISLIDYSIAGNSPLENLVAPNGWDTNSSLKLKSLLFEVDYQAFYSGTVVHSKDNGLDNITINDNPSSSLSLLESDGLYTKEKANRFGNKALTINARYVDKYINGVLVKAIDQLQPLGSVYEDNNNNDVIIYHREYQIWENEVVATYYGIHDYVLKNYYTSVYAKHRTWNLMPYGESVRRSENKKMMILLSKNKSYFENENVKFEISKIDESFYGDFINYLLSFYKDTGIFHIGDYDFKNINYGYIKHNNKFYASDVNSFTSGNSLCFNICMSDNLSMGNYISKINPQKNNDTYKVFSQIIETLAKSTGVKEISDIANEATSNSFLSYLFNKDVENDYTGSVQDRHSIYDDEETGTTEKMGFYLCHLDTKEILDDKLVDYNQSIVTNNYNKLINLPQIDSSMLTNESNKIGNEFDVYKDNKEVMDITYQIEPITNDNDIMFSSWLMKLSDIMGNYIKTNFPKKLIEINGGIKNYISIIANCVEYDSWEELIYGQSCCPIISVKIAHSIFSNLSSGLGEYHDISDIIPIIFQGNFSLLQNIGFHHKIFYYSFKPLKIKAIDNDTIKLYGTCSVKTVVYYHVPISAIVNTQIIELTLKKQNMNSYVFDGANYYLFSTADIHDINNISHYNENSIYYFGIRFNWTRVGVTNGRIINTDFENASYCDTFKTSFIKEDEQSNIKEKTYYNNMVIVASKSKLNKNMVYNEYAENELMEIVYTTKTNGYNDIKTTHSGNVDESKKDNHLYPNSVISFSKKNYEAPYLRIMLDSNTDIVSSVSNDGIIKIPTDTQSIQQWFFDENSQSYKFVFGINLSSGDWDIKEENDGSYKYSRIFTSWLSNRDIRVYNRKHFFENNILDITQPNILPYARNGQFYNYRTDVHERFIGIIDSATKTVVNRISSPDALDRTGILSVEDKIFTGDVLTITTDYINPLACEAGITFKVNDTVISGTTTTITVGADDLKIEASAVLKTFTLTPNIEAGSHLTITRKSSKYGNGRLGIITSNESLYYGDELFFDISVDQGYQLLSVFVDNKVYNLGETFEVPSHNISIINSVTTRTWNTILSSSTTNFENYSIMGLAYLPINDPISVHGSEKVRLNATITNGNETATFTNVIVNISEASQGVQIVPTSSSFTYSIKFELATTNAGFYNITWMSQEPIGTSITPPTQVNITTFEEYYALDNRTWHNVFYGSLEYDLNESEDIQTFTFSNLQGLHGNTLRTRLSGTFVWKIYNSDEEIDINNTLSFSNLEIAQGYYSKGIYDVSGTLSDFTKDYFGYSEALCFIRFNGITNDSLDFAYRGKCSTTGYNFSIKGKFIINKIEQYYAPNMLVESGWKTIFIGNKKFDSFYYPSDNSNNTSNISFSGLLANENTRISSDFEIIHNDNILKPSISNALTSCGADSSQTYEEQPENSTVGNIMLRKPSYDGMLPLYYKTNLVSDSLASPNLVNITRIEQYYSGSAEISSSKSWVNLFTGYGIDAHIITFNDLITKNVTQNLPSGVSWNPNCPIRISGRVDFIRGGTLPGGQGFGLVYFENVELDNFIKHPTFNCGIKFNYSSNNQITLTRTFDVYRYSNNPIGAKTFYINKIEQYY